MPAPAPADPSVITVVVGSDEAGARLDRVLTARIDSQTRSQIQRLIREGHACLGKQRQKASCIVRAGDVITLEVPAPRPAEPAPESLPISIVYDDPHLVIVDKPAGMVVHPAAGHRGGTLVNALLHHVQDLSGIGGQLRPGIVHRLDRGTSGLMVVAKHDRAHAALADQFRKREVVKRYTALVWGDMEAGVAIDLPLGRDPLNRKKISVRSHRPRAALTRVLRSESLYGLSLLEVSIKTGRTHQIRVHLSAVGHPIVADPTYGAGRRMATAGRVQLAISKLERPFLHASSLSFSHPDDGRQLTFSSALPPELQNVIETIRA